MSFDDFCFHGRDFDQETEKHTGVVFLDYNNFVKPISRDQKNKMIAHIANVFTLALLESQKEGLQTFDVHIQNISNLKTADVELSFCKELTILLNKMFENCLRKCYVIKPSKLFNNVYGVVESLLDKETKKKMVIVKE